MSQESNEDLESEESEEQESKVEKELKMNNNNEEQQLKKELSINIDLQKSIGEKELSINNKEEKSKEEKKSSINEEKQNSIIEKASSINDEDKESKEEKELSINKEEILSKNSEQTESKEYEQPQKLIIMLITKVKKDLPLPLNTLFFFIELFSYENNYKKITDDNNDLVFYLMNINWLDQFKSYYNYKCIEYIISKELKDDKNFVKKMDNLVNNQNPAKYYEDYKLVNKFNNIIINPKKKKKFDEKEEEFMPMKVEYDATKINKNINSSRLDTIDFFKYYPECVLINEKMRNILYFEYKYLKFSQFQKGDVSMVGKNVFIKLSNRIIEVCSFSQKNLIISPLYILYYFDISSVPFWENVLYKKDFKKDYLLKRIDKDDKHIKCMLDPNNKEYIGYSINLKIKYEGEPINNYDEERSVVADIKQEDLLNNIDIISKFNMDGYYKNKFEESMKKNSEDDSYNKFLLKMKLLREKKEKDLMEKQEQYIKDFDSFDKSDKSGSENTGPVNINGEIIGFIQGDDLTKNGEGFIKSSKDDDYISSITEMEKNKEKK